MLIALGSAGVAAHAQDKAGTPVAAADAEAEPRDAVALEATIVTAPGPEVREVTTAISVMTGERLAKAAIFSLDDLARLVPNVSFNTDFNSLYVRGIGTSEINIVSEQAVIYVTDGVYLPRIDYIKPGFLDVERVEIIKGAQAADFGRNATAGIVNIAYGQPTHDWYSSVTVAGGSSQLRRAEAVVAGPVTDDLSIRIAAGQLQQAGHTLNRADGQTLGDRDIRQARLKLQYTLTEALELSFSASYFDYFVGAWAGSEVFAYPSLLRPAIELLDVSFETRLDRQGSANRQNNSSGAGFVIPLQLRYESRDHAFTSTTAYSRLDDFQGGDIDGSAVSLAELLIRSDSRALSHEFRVTSMPGEFEYTAGLMLFTSRIDSAVGIPLGINVGTETLPGVRVLGPLGRLLEPDVLDSVTGLVLPGGAAATLDGRVMVDTESLGLFGHATWNLTDVLAFSFGGRYSRDVSRGAAMFADGGPVPLWSVLIMGGYDTRRKVDDDGFSPSLSLMWEASDDVALYASFAQGFRAGSYNIAAFAESDFEFEPERSKTYEAGIKTVLYDGSLRLNLGFFSTTYEGYQLSAFNGFSYTVTNAETVRSEGAEADATLLIHPGVTVTATAGFNKARFVKNTRAACPTVAIGEPGGLPPPGIGALPPNRVCDLSGQPLFRVPEWTGALGVNYQAPLAHWPVHVLAGANASYRGFEFMDSDLDPVDGQDAHWLYNAYLGLQDAADRWGVMVHGKNLGDELVKTFSGDVPLQAGAHWALTNAPRTFSLTLRINL